MMMVKNDGEFICYNKDLFHTDLYMQSTDFSDILVNDGEFICYNKDLFHTDLYMQSTDFSDILLAFNGEVSGFCRFLLD